MGDTSIGSAGGGGGGLYWPGEPAGPGLTGASFFILLPFPFLGFGFGFGFRTRLLCGNRQPQGCNATGQRCDDDDDDDDTPFV